MHNVKFFAFFISLCCFDTFSAPSIHFTDYRVLLTPEQSAKDYQIFNQGDTDAYCTTQVVDHNVSRDGKLSLAQADNKPSTSASDILRISPRRVLVPAKSNQKVKVVARRLRQMADGERVSYLNLRCKAQVSQHAGKIQIQPNFVFNIPVIVRKGQLPVEAKLENPKFLKSGNNLVASIDLVRSGKRSLYGNLVISDKTGILAVQKGISHYLQSDRVPLNVRLKHQPQGPVLIEFNELTQFGGDLSLRTQVQ